MEQNQLAELNDLVIRLHDIARELESIWPAISIAREVRLSADKLSELIGRPKV